MKACIVLALLGVYVNTFALRISSSTEVLEDDKEERPGLAGQTFKTLPDLPTLTPDNKDEFPEWHKYYEKVYQQPVSGTVDLNTFTWFYKFAPIPNLESLINTGDYTFRMENLPYGAAIRFTGPPKYQNGLKEAPEKVVTRSAGVFVKRPWDEGCFQKPSIEVIRTNSGEGRREPRFGGCWFYHAVGSGFVINTDHTFDRKYVKFNRLGSDSDDSDISLVMDGRPGPGSPPGPYYITEIIKQTRINCNAPNAELFRGTVDSHKKCKNVYGSDYVLKFEEDM